MNIDEIRSVILSAWEDLPTLDARAIAYDNTGYHLECNQVAEFFAGKKWQDISWPVVSAYRGDPSACLFFMSPQAYQHFLPSYMLVALNFYSESDVSADAAWQSLVPPIDPSLKKFWSERTSGFSAAQKTAIFHFLVFMQHEHGDDCWPPENFAGALAYWQNAL